MLTLRKLGSFVRHALGVSPEQAVADEYGVAEVVNLAGEWLCTAHRWDWLRNAAAPVDLVSGQDYALLPSDVRTVENIVATQGLSQFLVLTTMDSIMALRTRGVANINDWLASVNHRRLGDDAIPTPVLEVFPTPTADKAGIYTLHYTAGWKRLVDDDDACSIPEWMEGLMVQAAREYALGLEGDGGLGLTQRLSDLKRSDLFMEKKQRDGGLQWNKGPIRGGSAEDGGFELHPPYAGPFSNPS